MKRQNEFKTSPRMVIPTVVTVRPIVVEKEPSMKAAALSALGQTISRKWIALISLLVGIVFGLVVLGWGLWPVEYTGASYADLSPSDKGLLLQVASDLNAYDPNSTAVQQLRQNWPELDGLACFVANNQPIAEDEKIRLVSLAYKINQTGCDEYQHANTANE